MGPIDFTLLLSFFFSFHFSLFQPCSVLKKATRTTAKTKTASNIWCIFFHLFIIIKHFVFNFNLELSSFLLILLLLLLFLIFCFTLYYDCVCVRSARNNLFILFASTVTLALPLSTQDLSIFCLLFLLFS